MWVVKYCIPFDADPYVNSCKPNLLAATLTIQKLINKPKLSLHLEGLQSLQMPSAHCSSAADHCIRMSAPMRQKHSRCLQVKTQAIQVMLLLSNLKHASSATPNPRKHAYSATPNARTHASSATPNPRKPVLRLIAPPPRKGFSCPISFADASAVVICWMLAQTSVTFGVAKACQMCCKQKSRNHMSHNASSKRHLSEGMQPTGYCRHRQAIWTMLRCGLLAMLALSLSADAVSLRMMCQQRAETFCIA